MTVGRVFEDSNARNTTALGIGTNLDGITGNAAPCLDVITLRSGVKDVFLGGPRE